MKTSMLNQETGSRRWVKYLFPTFLFLCSLAFFTTSCNDDDDNVFPPAIEKVVLMFGVDKGDGGLSAEIVNKVTTVSKELQSPVEIEKGTTVHFVAKHSKSWTIDYWKINGVIIRSVEPEQTFVINEHKDVRVAFKPYMPVEPSGYSNMQ